MAGKQKLFTKEDCKKLPKINNGDGTAYVKFFTPDANWTWYATEYDGEDIFYGLVDGFEKEIGYFSLFELKNVKGPLGLSIERDQWWTPKKVYEMEPEFKILV